LLARHTVRAADESLRTRAALTSTLPLIVWWSFLIGHVVNNIRGFGSLTSLRTRSTGSHLLRDKRSTVLYVVALKLDLALFTVYPSIGVVLLGTHHARESSIFAGVVVPAMYWYGWTATAALGALMVGLVAALLPERWIRWFWSGWLWVVPAVALSRAFTSRCLGFDFRPSKLETQGEVGRSHISFSKRLSSLLPPTLLFAHSRTESFITV
jgi:hypothetical protein